MKLFRLPYLVQKEILNHFALNEILIFSMCSQKLKNLISFCLKTRFDQIEYVNYEMYPSKTEVWAGRCSEVAKPILSIISPLSGTGRSGKKRKYGTGAERPMKGTVSGMGVQFLKSNYPGQLAVAYHHPLPMDKPSVGCHSQITEFIHEHILTLFGNHTKYHLYVNTNNRYFTTFTNISSLPKLKNLTKAYIHGLSIKTEQLEHVFSEPANLEYVQLLANIEGRLLENSPLLRLKNLEISTQINAEILTHFNGKRLKIHIAEKDSVEVVIKFFNEWKLSNTGQNLETLEFCQKWDSMGQWDEHWFDNETVGWLVNKDQLEKTAGMKKLESGKPVFIIDEQWKNSTQDYIVREKDGQLATVLIDYYIIHFKVLDLTEKELLEQIEKDDKYQ